jgi:hypothetical protein
MEYTCRSWVSRPACLRHPFTRLLANTNAHLFELGEHVRHLLKVVVVHGVWQLGRPGAHNASEGNLAAAE